MGYENHVFILEVELLNGESDYDDHVLAGEHYKLEEEFLAALKELIAKPQFQAIAAKLIYPVFESE